MCPVLRVLLRGQCQGQYLRSLNYSCLVCVSQKLFDQDLRGYSCMFLITGASVTQLGDLASCSRTFSLVFQFSKFSTFPNLHHSTHHVI